MIPNGLKKWLAFGRGAGIEIRGPQGAEALRVTAVRVRPGGATKLGELTIDDASHHAAGVWGTDYAAFLRQHGVSHAAATVLLPRRDVIVRQLALPGVSDKDLSAAIQFQLDGLHPYADEEAVSSWARLPGTSSVLIAITRRAVIDRFTTLFAEAGIKIRSFTCSAAVVYSARRLFGSPATPEILAYDDSSGSAVEVYGESAAHPVFSATFEVSTERAIALAASELRLDPAAPLKPLEEVVGAAPAYSYAAALASACPRLTLPLELLPAELRITGSALAWIPSGALGLAVLMLAGALSAFPAYESRRYLRSLNSEIARMQPAANRSLVLDRQIETTRARTLLLDEVRSRSRSDMDVLNEMTRILPPPTWLNLLDITRSQVTIAGETGQTAPLLQVIDSSPLFQATEFAMAPMRTSTGETFRIRTTRKAGR
jgi:Tfp pilus assembly protein PilN